MFSIYKTFYEKYFIENSIVINEIIVYLISELIDSRYQKISKKKWEKNIL